MKTDRLPDTGRAGELRRAFDLSFAEPPPAAIEAFEDLLHIRLGTVGYALRVTEIAGLFTGVKITPLPATVPELLGIAGFRGSILPVYDLGALLGYARETEPRWLAIAAAASVGLAFGAFERQVRIHPQAIVPDAHGGTVRRHVREVVQVEGVVRPLLSVPSVLEDITIRARADGSRKE